MLHCCSCSRHEMVGVKCPRSVSLHSSFESDQKLNPLKESYEVEYILDVNMSGYCCTARWQGRWLVNHFYYFRARGAKTLALWSEWFESCLKTYDLKSVSPINQSHPVQAPRGSEPTGQPVTKANQHFKETNSMTSRGTQASVKTQPNLSVIISLAKQTSNYVKTTLASEKKLEYSVLWWGCGKI